MNIFRILGDVLHVASIILLLLKIRKTRSCAGISLKTQELYALVFVTRYLDLFDIHLNFLSFYNFFLKLVFLATSIYTVYLIRFRYRNTYDAKHDSFRIIFLIVPCAFLSLMLNEAFTIMEIAWAFSIYLEAVAILPQLFMIQRTGEVENLTKHYIFCMGAYRGAYILNWIWRFATERKYRQWIVWISGLVQTALYADFFYYYFLSLRSGVLVLPNVVPRQIS